MDKEQIAKIYKEFCQHVLAESGNPESKVHNRGLCSSLWEYMQTFEVSVFVRNAVYDYQTGLFEDAGLNPLYPWNSSHEAYKLDMRIRHSMHGARLEWVKEHAQ